jgi:predicted nucleic acid-binding Zn ribbon protein
MAKCSYCNQKSGDSKMVINTWDGTTRRDVTFYYCSEECKIQVEEFSKRLNKQSKQFLLLISVLVLAFIVLPVLTSLFSDKNLFFISFGIPLICLGVVLFKNPFATPESTRSLGIKKSQKLLKMIGIILIFVGFSLQVINFVFLCAVP